MYLCIIMSNISEGDKMRADFFIQELIELVNNAEILVQSKCLDK